MKRFLTFLMTVLLLVCTTGSVYAEEYVNMDKCYALCNLPSYTPRNTETQC